MKRPKVSEAQAKMLAKIWADGPLGRHTFTTRHEGHVVYNDSTRKALLNGGLVDLGPEVVADYNPNVSFRRMAVNEQGLFALESFLMRARHKRMAGK